MASLTDISSAKAGVAVTKSDSTILEPTRALLVGGAGDLVVKFSGSGETITLKVAAGYHPLSVTQVRNATTATDIVALY